MRASEAAFQPFPNRNNAKETAAVHVGACRYRVCIPGAPKRIPANIRVRTYVYVRDKAILCEYKVKKKKKNVEYLLSHYQVLVLFTIFIEILSFRYSLSGGSFEENSNNNSNNNRY